MVNCEGRGSAPEFTICVHEISFLLVRGNYFSENSENFICLNIWEPCPQNDCNIYQSASLS